MVRCDVSLSVLTVCPLCSWVPASVTPVFTKGAGGGSWVEEQKLWAPLTQGNAKGEATCWLFLDGNQQGNQVVGGGEAYPAKPWSYGM